VAVGRIRLIYMARLEITPPRIQGPVLYEAGAILAVSAYVVDCSNFITAAHRYRGSGAGSSMSL